MTNKLMKILFVFLTLFVLSACDPAEDEAKKLGFNDVQDMRSIQAQGWHTKNKYEEDQARAGGFESVAAMKVAMEKNKQEAEALKIKMEAEAQALKVKKEAEAAARLKYSEACVYNLAEVIYDYAFNNGRVSGATEEIGFYIQAVRMSKGMDLEQERQLSQKKNVAYSGLAKFQDRVLPACIEKIQLNFVNRSQGVRKEDCYALAYIHDKEFHMYRQMKAMLCEELEMQKEAWKNEANVIELQ